MPYYNIIKIMTNNGRKVHVLLTDGISQILEINKQEEAEKMVKLLNENSDSGWTYETRLSPNRVGGKNKTKQKSK